MKPLMRMRRTKMKEKMRMMRKNWPLSNSFRGKRRFMDIGKKCRGKNKKFIRKLI
jgi:hypothetical protein